MTLKEKVEQADFSKYIIEKLNDEFAIGFAEWCLNYIPENIITSKQLLEIYKKEKGL